MADQHNFITCHPDTGFLGVCGPDAVPFLQSILTANVETLAVGAARPGALLTPQGRVLIDMMIYRTAADAFVMRTDAARRDDLFTRLRRYRLRRPVDMSMDADMRLGLYFGSTPPAGISDIAVFADPRHECLGHHILYRRADDLARFATANAIGQIDADGQLMGQWHARRIAAGVPEGPIDLTPERALMLEAGLDHLQAVDFGKGCYIGQEVTARTHYRGLVKRRLVPLVIKGPVPATGSDVTRDGTVIGTTKTSAARHEGDAAGAICLSLLKLTDIHQIDAAGKTDAPLLVDGHAAVLAIPDWMRPLPLPQKP